MEKRQKIATATTEEAQTTWEWIAAVPKANWQNKLICYLHRTAPIIDLGSGKSSAIEIIAHPFDLTYILKTHGSGGYRFDISVIPEDGSRQTRIKQFYETVFDVRYPPRIPYGSWVDDGRNADWAWAKPALLEEAQKLNTGQPQEQQSPAQTLVDYLDVATKVKELSGGNEDAGLVAMVFRMLESNQQAMRDYQDPTKQMATLKAIMEMAGPRREDGGGMGMLVEILREELRSVREDLRAVRSQPTADPLTGLKGTLETLKELGLVGNPGAAAKGGGNNQLIEIAGNVVDKLLDKASEVAPIIVEGYKFGKDRDFQIARMNQTQQQARPWEFPGNQSAPPAATPVLQPQPVAPSGPPAPAVDPNAPMTYQTLFAKYGQLMQRNGPFLLDHFKRLDGHAFREFLQDREGSNLWSEFVRDATPQLLTEGLLSTPQGKMLFGPEEKVLAFFEDMLDESEEDEDENDGQQPIGGTND